MIDDKEAYEYLFNLTNSYDFSKIHFIHQKFVCFVLMYGSRANDIDLLTFLKEEIMVPSYNERYRLYDETYKKVYLSILSSFSRYKEAYTYLKEQGFKSYLINKKF